MADMMDKSVVFLAVDGFEAGTFKPLWECFGNLNASTRVASFNADDEVKDNAGLVNTHSDMSFDQAGLFSPDVIVIADGITAGAIKDDPAAQQLLQEAFDRKAAIVSVNGGAAMLASMGFLNGLTVAAPEFLKDELENAGAVLSVEPIAVSQNIFSAIGNADLQAFCDMVSEYITGRMEQAA
ncbi:MAG: DJ-1/PfpI family protein [Candidatus Aquicultor sp.]